MSSFSLEKNMRTCKAQPSWAERYASDRFLNPNNLLCPIWTNTDMYGRSSDANAFTAETAGCFSSLNRVDIENANRPTSFSSVTLGDYGLQGELKTCDPQSLQRPLGTMYTTKLLVDPLAYWNVQARENQFIQFANKIIERKYLSGMNF